MSGPDVTEKLRKAREAKEAQEAAVTDETTPTAETVQAPVSDQTTAAPAKEKRKKDPVPEGFMVPVEFAKHLTKVRRESDPTADEVRPQVVYGYTKTMKGFPSQPHTDGRPLIPVDEATKFLVQRETERKAAKEAKATANAAKAETPAESTNAA
jgi:hypothetical protein